MKNLGSYKIMRQGQITIPAEARKELDLKEGDISEMQSSYGIYSKFISTALTGHAQCIISE